MSCGGHTAEENMGYLAGLMRSEEYAIKVALLNEASVYHLKAADAEAVSLGGPPTSVFSEDGIKGRDFFRTDAGDRRPTVRTKWSSAVMSALGPRLLGEDDVRAVAPSRTPDIPFATARPGTWIAAKVKIGDEDVACVSLYGLIEEFTDASMHTALSEISPIFSDPRHKDLVLLGGDFNISTAFKPPDGERSRLVLDRIRAYGMVDCLAKWREDNNFPRLPGCLCEDEPCRHTLTRLDPKTKGKDIDDRMPTQDDYLFASQTLADRLDDVVEIAPDEWERYSDHRPIIVKFKAA